MSEKAISRLIFIISVIVPVVAITVIYTPAIHLNINVSFLPEFHAIINSCVTVLLLCGYYFIRHNKIRAHRLCMLSAFSLSSLFLVSYLIYHASTEETHYGGTGILRILYFTILISHILLAMIIMPFILITLSRALTERFDKHRRIARITWPLWLYVSTTGVIVYFLISPYYAH